MIDKSKNMRIKKELKSYISTFYDKISDKENEEMANKLLEKYNTDKDFNKRVEKIGKKLQSSTSTKSKKGGRRKTRKRQKGGMEDVSIAIIAASIIIGGALIYLGRSLRYGAERMGATVGSVASSMQLNRTPSSEDDNNSPPRTPPRQRHSIINRPENWRSGSNNDAPRRFQGTSSALGPGELSRQFSNRTSRMYARVQQQDDNDLLSAGLSSPFRVVGRGQLNPNEDNDSSIVTEDNILGTPSVNRVGRYGLRRRAATAPPVMDNTTTTSSSDDEFTPYSPGMRILRGDSDSESPERPEITGRHNSSHLGGRKRKTLRKRKKRRKKITIKRK